MNVYDTVNKLAQEIKDSEEFKNYKLESVCKRLYERGKYKYVI